MGNEPHTFSVGPLEARHVPEPDETHDPSAHDVAEPVTGFVDIGAEVDGVFVTLVRRKASGLIADVNRAQASKPAESEQQQSPPAEQQQPPPAESQQPQQPQQ